MMIKIYGMPAPKGSMKCVGQRGRRRHVVVPDDPPGLEKWHRKIMKAGKLAVEKYEPMSGPIAVALTFTFDRPASTTVTGRPWPVTRVDGRDVDKLARAVLDALDDAGLYGDDSQIVTVTSTKTFPDTPGATDRLDRPGVIIRIESLNA